MWWLTLALTLVVVALIGLAVRDALTAAQLVRGAADGLRAVDADVSADQLRRELLEADTRLYRAERLLDRPATRTVAAVPLLGRSWVAERRVVQAGRAALAGADLVAAAAPDLQADGGGLNVAVLSELGARLEVAAGRAEEALRELAETPTGLTPSPVSAAVRDAEAALEPVVTGLGTGASGAHVAASLLGAAGPRTLLLALQNNAELRGAGGYVSTFATGTLDDGRLELEPFRDVIDVLEPPEHARRVPASAAFRADYGEFLADTTFWRMWTMTPHVPDAAAVGAEVAAQLLGTRPDVVLLLDVPAVAALVALGGEPVVLADGSTVPPDELVEALLVDSYAQAGDQAQDQDARRTGLRAAAGTAAAQLLRAEVDPLEAVRELGRLAGGRHLTMWSGSEAEQARLVELGLAGAVDAGSDDLVMVSVNNLSANKLDYYVDRLVEHEVVLGQDTAEVVQRVQLVSRAPADLVPYVEGVATPGTSSQRVELSVAANATVESVTVDGEPAEADVRFDERRGRVFTYLFLERGQQVDIELRYRVPVENGSYVVQALPQALARDADLRVAVMAAEGEVLQSPADFEPDGDGVQRTAPWQEREVLEFGLEQPGRWERVQTAVRRFWDEPVRIG